MGIGSECRRQLLSLLDGRGIEFTEDGVPIRPQSLCICGNDIPTGVARGELDYAVFVHFLEHFSDPAELLARAWSMIAPGGVLLLVLPDKHLYPAPGEKGNPDHLRTYDADDAYATLDSLGFRYTTISSGVIESIRSFWVAVKRIRGFGNTPRYSVVIPSHDRWDLTEQCLQSIEDAGWSPECVVLVDDGSDSPMPVGLYTGNEFRMSRVSPVRLEQQSGFPTAVNAGVDFCTGGNSEALFNSAVTRDQAPFIVILNNDVIVHEGGDHELLAPLGDPRVAVAGPSGARLNENWEYAGAGTDYIEFYCAAVRASIWNDLGGLDAETFGLGYGEDSDYCIRARRAGYTLAITGEVCTHEGGQTFSSVGGVKPLIDRNRRSLIRRHRKGRVIWALGSLGTSGGIRVIWNCAQAMRDAGWETSVTLVDPKGRGHGPVDERWREFIHWDPSLAKSAPEPFDIAIGTFWSTWPHVLDIPAKRRIGFVQSDEPEWYQDARTRDAATSSFSLGGIEHIVVSERMLEFGEKYGHNIIGVAENGVDSLVYTPLWYEERVWPHRVMVVRKGSKVWFDGQEFADRAVQILTPSVAGLEYVVVGGSRVPASGVTCRIDNVNTYDPHGMAAVYNSAGVYVIPSMIEGSSLTVLEAMACGTPVVCTEIASDAVVDRHNAIVVPYCDAKAIAEAVTMVFCDDKLKWRLYHEGLKTAHGRTLERQRIQFMEAIGE